MRDGPARYRLGECQVGSSSGAERLGPPPLRRVPGRFQARVRDGSVRRRVPTPAARQARRRSTRLAAAHRRPPRIRFGCGAAHLMSGSARGRPGPRQHTDADLASRSGARSAAAHPCPPRVRVRAQAATDPRHQRNPARRTRPPVRSGLTPFRLTTTAEPPNPRTQARSLTSQDRHSLFPPSSPEPQPRPPPSQEVQVLKLHKPPPACRTRPIPRAVRTGTVARCGIPPPENRKSGERKLKRFDGVERSRDWR